LERKEVEVTFRTITPLWTGDAWQKNSGIRPSSLIGSLRFWFEVICYFTGITNNENYKDGKLQDNLNEKEFKEKVLKNGTYFKGIDKTLAELGISLPSRIFGCTGWKGWIRIKKIEPIEDYCFGNRLNLPFGIAIKKGSSDGILPFSTKEEFENFVNSNYQGSNWKAKLEKFREQYSVWYFSIPYFDGKFTITFEIEDEIVEPVFFPLLTFMEKYGFWGGKWNIGYGRLKIENIKVKEDDKWIEINSWTKDEVILKDFNVNDIDIGELINQRNLNKNSKPFELLKRFLSVDSFYCKNEKEFREKTKNITKKVVLLNIDDTSDNYRNLIEEILRIKIKIRDCLRHICEEKSEQNNKDKGKKQKKSKFEECFDENGNFQKDKEIECKSIKYKCKEIDRWRIFRHELLGERGKGSKIFPFIYEENNQLKGGLISIAGLLNLD
jgi:CRISPR-associated protein Cmr1